MMYSWEISKLLLDNNYVISEDDYKKISAINNNPQIIDIKYDAFSDLFSISTSDGYFWSFSVKKD